MPLLGLPRTLESVLAALLLESQPSSFRIDGNSDGSRVLVIRFPSVQAQGQSVQTQGLNTPTKQNARVYRQKAPSTIARDRRRNELRKQKQQVCVENNSTNPLFSTTPPSAFMCKPHENEISERQSGLPNTTDKSQGIDLDIECDPKTVTLTEKFECCNEAEV